MSWQSALEYGQEFETAILAATEAGLVVRDLYDRAAAATYAKTDGSPVTDADLAADRVVRASLAERFPDDPILTEEGADDAGRLASSRCWIVDPIDGTEQFLRRTGDFDILVALVVAGRPVVAAGYQPTAGLLCAAALGEGAWTRRDDDPTPRPVRLEPVPPGGAPRLATATWFGAPDNLDIVKRVAQRLGLDPPTTEPTGFSPRIFLPGRRCEAMLGIRAGADQSMAWEWDFAVTDLFIHEAGGVVTDLRGAPHQYNKRRPRNRNGLVAAVNPATHGRLLAAVRPELPTR